MHKSEIGFWDLNEVNIVTTGYVLDFISTVTVTWPPCWANCACSGKPDSILTLNRGCVNGCDCVAPLSSSCGYGLMIPFPLRYERLNREGFLYWCVKHKAWLPEKGQQRVQSRPLDGLLKKGINLDFYLCASSTAFPSDTSICWYIAYVDS